MGGSLTQFDEAVEAAEFLRGRGFGGAEVAVVLGSGLGDFADSLAEAFEVSYGEIPHWPASGVIGHAGRLVGGLVGGRRVIALAGRVHVYEGRPLARVTFAMRVMGRLGVPRVILTNAAGGINTRFSRGTLMLIDDHINLMGTNPLVGPNDERFGPRFPDMSEIYALGLRRLAREAAAEAGVPLEHGVYVAVHGPSYETPAEIRAFRVLGADAVGMSTAPEALVARHMGLEVLGISCITNMAAGVLPEPLDHREVMETARRVRGQFIAVLEGTVGRL
ncbi:MAG TPA: purine-nucleoside phosphorylase [Vicinamibacterales bacterium]|nr:purine-nucleoside phosphorylase [Vicinamibacterales bacterium]